MSDNNYTNANKVINKATGVSVPNYGKSSRWEKVKRRLKATISNRISNSPLKFKFYRSYWHFYLLKHNRKTAKTLSKGNLYITQIPNYGAGIGHQLANWNTGLYAARYFDIKYAHSPFSTEKWESFFGFGENEIFALKLQNDLNYKVVELPKFDFNNNQDVTVIKNIILSYHNSSILFLLQPDQGYPDQYATYKELSGKFFNAFARASDELIYLKGSYNIAVHIRRRMAIETDENWKSRGLDNQYFLNTLNQVLKITNNFKPANVYLFSQGGIDDFAEFKQFENVIYCMEMGPLESFLHMVNADILISSKSSFSYKPALISNGIKICPQTFWHKYPSTDDFILADNNGDFDTSKFSFLINQHQVNDRLSNDIS